MKVIVFGATGMIGQGVVRECLLDADVERVLAVGRRPSGQSDPKLRDLVVPDLTDYAAVARELEGYDACFFCLGVSSAGMGEAEYRRVTFDIAVAAARALVAASPRMTFIFVSGAGTDAKSKTMWARVKGETEVAILALPFERTYAFRPAFVRPEHGIRSRTFAYRALYAALTPIAPVFESGVSEVRHHHEPHRPRDVERREARRVEAGARKRRHRRRRRRERRLTRAHRVRGTGALDGNGHVRLGVLPLGMRLRSASVLAPLLVASFAASPARADDPAEPLPPLPSAAPSAPPSSPATEAPAPAVPPPTVAAAPPEAAPPVVRRSEEEGRRHDGFYLRFSFGGGGTALQKMGSGIDSGYGGGAAALQIGGTPVAGVVIGAGFRMPSAGDIHVDGNSYTWGATTGVFGPFVDWFPDPRGGWHVGAMPGLGSTTFDNHASHVWSANGFGLSVFGGYDAWVGREISLGVDASITGVTRADVSDGGSQATGISVAPVSLSLAFTLLYH